MAMVVMSVSVLAQNSTVPHPTPFNVTDGQYIKTKQSFAIMRGSMVGFRRGLYKNPKYVPNKYCLGDLMMTSSLKLYSNYNEHLNDYVDNILQAYELYYYFNQFCDYDDTVDDLL